MSVILGFDFGTQKIGIATGQLITATASPLQTYSYQNKKLNWDYFADLIHQWKPNALVVGLPFQLDNQASETAPRAKRFARQLHGRFNLAVYMVDERLTSMDAKSQLGKQAKNPLLVDAMAAKLILETWLSLSEIERQQSALVSNGHIGTI